MNLRTSLACAAALFSIATAASAIPSSIGKGGHVATLTIHEPTSDEAGMQHGTIKVDEGGGVLRTYRWGGSFCPSFPLRQSSVDILSRTQTNYAMWVIPRYRNGNGSERCLVGFELRDQGLYID